MSLYGLVQKEQNESTPSYYKRVRRQSITYLIILRLEIARKSTYVCKLGYVWKQNSEKSGRFTIPPLVKQGLFDLIRLCTYVESVCTSFEEIN